MDIGSVGTFLLQVMLCATLLMPSLGCSDKGAEPVMTEVDCEQAAADATLDIVGLRDRGACAWLGLRYAEPITPSGRFLPPELRPLGSGSITATDFGADCLQSNNPMSEQPQSEDCLFLNIWAPGESSDGTLQRQLPVMVWIHGGGFTQGAGNWSLYNGAAFARQGVVLVAINYRLGALGFAAPDGVTHDNGTELAGNLGVRDTLTALEWVQQHIARFGGDPDRVTVFGESAGAWMTCALLAAGAGDDGLLHRAIMESGGCYIASRERAAEFGQK
ncbi:MAG: carboxylesterase/lipase family protein, partial [Candidatus Dadabacteria bacterium]